MLLAFCFDFADELKLRCTWQWTNSDRENQLRIKACKTFSSVVFVTFQHKLSPHFDVSFLKKILVRILASLKTEFVIDP